MAELNLPIWLHPVRSSDIADYRSETHSKYMISHTIGWPYETGAAMTRLVFGGILEKYPEIDLEKGKFGIFGKLSKTDAVLRDRDRIEIYRPLIADPKEVRRKRAEEGKVMKKGGGDL